MTSLKSGLPSRDTWVKGPLTKPAVVSSAETLARWRLALVQTPIVGRPLRVRWEIGTWIAMECTYGAPRQAGRRLVVIGGAARGQARVIVGRHGSPFRGAAAMALAPVVTHERTVVSHCA